MNSSTHLNIKPLPSLLPEHESRQTWQDTPGQAAENATLAQTHGSAVCLARSTAQAAQAYIMLLVNILATIRLYTNKC